MWKTLKENFESPDSYVSLALGLAVVLVVGMISFNYFKAKSTPSSQSETNKTETSQGAIALPAQHTVKTGDTLWSIAETYYKNGYNWVDIQKANNLTNADSLANGQILTIPEIKPMATPTGEVSSAATEVKSEKKQYTVAPGDSLWKIALKEYNNGYKWVEIAKVNKLAHPDIIHAGNVFVLP